MKNIILSFCSLLFTLAATAGNGDAILGNWYNQDKDAKVMIYKLGDHYYGKVVWIKDPYDPDGKTLKLDKNNCNKSLTKRPILNIDVLQGFAYSKGIWTQGYVYDPNSGHTYDCNLKLEGNILKIRGYISNPMFGRTVIWVRAVN